MTARIQRFGRAAQIRTYLATLPPNEGATAEQIIAGARLDCTNGKLSSSLSAMCDTGQAVALTWKGKRTWALSGAMHKLMRAQDTQPTRRAAASAARPMPTGSNNSTTVLHKDQERQELAHLLAEFRKRGGKIEVLGTTPIRAHMTRRQVNDADGDSRRARASSPAPTIHIEKEHRA